MNEIKKYYSSTNDLLAIFVPCDYQCEGINFVTEGNEYQQIAVMNHKSGHIIVPHFHNRIKREIDYTTETLVIRKGVLKVTLYENEKPIHEFDAGAGDIVTLFFGGHGFKVINDVDMVEIKQGPFMGNADKTRF